MSENNSQLRVYLELDQDEITSILKNREKTGNNRVTASILTISMKAGQPELHFAFNGDISWYAYQPIGPDVPMPTEGDPF